MTELKTLKDLQLGYEGYPPEDESIRKRLIQEAIKWIEQLEQKIRIIQTNNFNLPYQPKPEEWIECEGLLSQIRWIKLFFNITDEELK